MIEYRISTYFCLIRFNCLFTYYYLHNMSSNRKIANYVDQSQIDILEQELKEISDKYPYLASLGEAGTISCLFYVHF